MYIVNWLIIWHTKDVYVCLLVFWFMLSKILHLRRSGQIFVSIIIMILCSISCVLYIEQINLISNSTRFLSAIVGLDWFWCKKQLRTCSTVKHSPLNTCISQHKQAKRDVRYNGYNGTIDGTTQWSRNGRIFCNPLSVCTSWRLHHTLAWFQRLLALQVLQLGFCVSTINRRRQAGLVLAFCLQIGDGCTKACKS